MGTAVWLYVRVCACACVSCGCLMTLSIASTLEKSVVLFNWGSKVFLQLYRSIYSTMVILLILQKVLECVMFHEKSTYLLPGIAHGLVQSHLASGVAHQRSFANDARCPASGFLPKGLGNRLVLNSNCVDRIVVAGLELVLRNRKRNTIYRNGRRRWNLQFAKVAFFLWISRINCCVADISQYFNLRNLNVVITLD